MQTGPDPEEDGYRAPSFTICLCISPDLDVNRGKCQVMFHGMFHGTLYVLSEILTPAIYVCVLVRTETGTEALKMKHCDVLGTFHDMFVH
jgi:hypothetical protein